METIENLPNFSLETYRKNASFKWKKMKKILYSEESLVNQAKFYEELKNNTTLLKKFSSAPSQSTQKKIAINEMFDIIGIKKRWEKENMSPPNDLKVNLIDVGATLKFGLDYNLFLTVVSRLGTQIHQEYVKKHSNGEIVGSFGLTEIGHGSDINKMQTTAKYDNDAKEFVINTPSFAAAKCWMGNVGKIATHMALYAQLITPDNINRGLHVFLIEIRNPSTLLPPLGVVITDLGEKIGLEPLDNGFIMFNNYRVPKESLLNKLADVSDNGTYKPYITNPTTRLGMLLSTISSGRVRALGFSAIFIRNACAIAIRYAASSENKGVPILEYPSHNTQLVSSLATAYVGHIMHNELRSIQNDLLTSSKAGVNSNSELHAIISAAKPVFTWLARDGMRSCWEFCGKNGYLKVSGVESIIKSCDPLCTFEGDNYVLIQQAANWLLKLWPFALQENLIDFPLESVNFINNAKKILQQKFSLPSSGNLTDLPNLLMHYQWLTCYFLKITYEKQELSRRDDKNSYSVRNNSQVYFSKTLSTVYVLHFFIQRTHRVISNISDSSSKMVLLKLLSLFAMWNLQKYVQYFYQGNYTNGPEFVDYLEESIIRLCQIITSDAVALVDAIVPADFLLGSVLGHSDGNIHTRLESSITHTYGTFAKVAWGNELRNCVSKL